MRHIAVPEEVQQKIMIARKSLFAKTTKHIADKNLDEALSHALTYIGVYEGFIDPMKQALPDLERADPCRFAAVFDDPVAMMYTTLLFGIAGEGDAASYQMKGDGLASMHKRVDTLAERLESLGETYASARKIRERLLETRESYLETNAHVRHIFGEKVRKSQA